MAQASWPSPDYNDRVVTDAEYELLSARFSDDGVYGSPADSAVVTAAPGLNVQVSADVGASVRGHYWTSGSAPFTLPVTANASGQTRYDRVVLRLDRSTWQVTAAVRQGAPGSSAPSLVRDTGGTGLWEVPVAQVTVPNGATSVTVQRQEQYVGTRIRPCNSSSRPLFPQRGEQAFETDTGRLVLWTGTTWAVLHEPGQSTIPTVPLSGWETSVETVLELERGLVTCRLGSWKRTGGTLAAATNIRLPITIPEAYRHPTRAQYAGAYVTGQKPARITVNAANAEDGQGQVYLTQHPDIAEGDFVQGTSIAWRI